MSFLRFYYGFVKFHNGSVVLQGFWRFCDGFMLVSCWFHDVPQWFCAGFTSFLRFCNGFVMFYEVL